MKVSEIVNLMEKFAPLELQEAWDCCGFAIDLGEREIKKILLCLTVTEQIINQASEKSCDMIISHHPLFSVPLAYNKNIPIYCAHTNLDKTNGGTTDTLIELLGFNYKNAQKIGDFLRILELENENTLIDFIKLIKNKLGVQTLRVVNNSNKTKIKRIAFCAGSGADFLGEAQKIRADVFVTGDIKYHTALDSDIILIDAGHYETERPVLNTIKKILSPHNLKVKIADEKSPFINY